MPRLSARQAPSSPTPVVASEALARSNWDHPAPCPANLGRIGQSRPASRSFQPRLSPRRHRDFH
jgi:hypothetical protein